MPYWRLFRAGWRRQSTYRLAALGGLIANVTFGFLKVALLLATVDAAGGSVRGYDAATMSAYIWVSQGLLGSINLNGRSDLADRIKDGSVVVDLLRPVNLVAATYAAELGRALFSLIPRALPSIAIGALVVGMAMPTEPWPYLLGLLSVVLGALISIAACYLVAVSGFWLV